ncbi:MAG TPA: FtsX-like permease family protein [Oligoflexia bacterium]|nr:FtsX-like permease family protein [Oligoflexia bacterium]HMP48077.1 FtsX-like permease family protein [Oligoflexia bacterium]
MQTIFLIFSLAYRNILKNTGRSIITGMAVAFATIILIFFVSLQLSAYQTSINLSTSVLHGHAQIMRTGYEGKPEFDKRFSLETSEYYDIEKYLESQSIVGAVSPRAISYGMISSEERTFGAEIMGIDPEREKLLSTIPGTIWEGRYLDSGAEIVMGSALARNLKVGTGNEVTVISTGNEGSLVAEIFEVVGVFESGIREADSAIVQIPIKHFQDIFGIGSEIHSLVIKTGDTSGFSKNISYLQKALSMSERNLDVYLWSDLLPGLQQAIHLDMAIGSFFYMCLLLVVGSTLGNTFVMAVIERKKEFAVIRALGASSNFLAAVVFVESILLTLMGIFLGIISGVILVYYFSIYGFSIPGSEEVAKRLNIQSVVYPWITVASLTAGPIALLIMSFIAVLYPMSEPGRVSPEQLVRT